MVPVKFGDFVAKSGFDPNDESIIGSLLYLTIGSVLINREKMKEIIKSVGLSESLLTKRISFIDAFNSATGDISTKTVIDGRLNKIYVRDNEKDKQSGYISRELVREVVGTRNNYIRVGCFRLDLNAKTIESEVTDYTGSYDYYSLTRKVDQLYELYNECYNRNSVETIIDNVIDEMDASKVAVHGKLFFVPRYYMDRIATLEALAEEINYHNMTKNLGLKDSTMSLNSIPVENDEKQRSAFEKEYYTTVEKEIEFYQDRLQHFIQNGSTSEKIISKWVDKVKALQEKRLKYEELFKTKLNKLDEEFESINISMQELQLRLLSAGKQ